MNSDPRRVAGPAIVLAGPTATGKSAVAVALAERLGGEIISVDSMLVYRGLDIGTAKPSAADRARVAHHLIDVVDLTESFDAAKFVELATEVLAGLRSRGRLAILCGGTGLYFQALLKGIGRGPPGDPELRKTLEKTPLAVLLQELEERDPETYVRIDRKNPRRVVRAVEVLRLTGKSFIEQRADWTETSGSVSGSDIVLTGMMRSPEDLRRRIDVRVDQMFEQGLVAETERLLREGLEQNPTAMQAIGYRQVVEHLSGERGRDETVALIKQRTRQYAKRQMTWFRHQMSLTWISVGPAATPVETAAQIAELYLKRKAATGA